jgi:hypothetical protein
MSDKVRDNHRVRVRTLLDVSAGQHRTDPPVTAAPELLRDEKAVGSNPPPRPLVRRVWVSRLGVGCRWRACVRGFGRLGHPLALRFSLVSVSYSAGQQPFEPVPPQLSCTRSGGTRGTASWGHLCVINGADGLRRWVVPNVRQEAGATTDEGDAHLGSSRHMNKHH